MVGHTAFRKYSKGEIKPSRVYKIMRGCIFEVNPKGLGW